MKVEMFEIQQGVKYLISATRLGGATFAFDQTWNKLKSEFVEGMATSAKTE